MMTTSIIEVADCVFIQTPPAELREDAELVDVWAGMWLSKAYSFDLSWVKQDDAYRLSGLVSHSSNPLLMVGSACLVDKHQQRKKAYLDRTGKFVFTGLKKASYTLGFIFETHDVAIAPDINQILTTSEHA